MCNGGVLKALGPDGFSEIFYQTYWEIINSELGEEYLFKVVLIIDSAVGKSHLLSQLATNKFNQNSKAIFGVKFQTQVVEINGKEIKAQIWDTAGQQNSLSLPSACKAFELTKTPTKFIATFDIEGHDP
ncbi:hypothetical protein M0R45_015080 [Rubus argutus]|uniref:Uncharacterized protein n=1 Tax=Rubus argutus TaxID=59490 RepID=A0AAW1XNM7_RUBAR